VENKKQAFNIIESICKLNNDQWDNKAGSYDDATESAYQIEEALEGLTQNGIIYLDNSSFKSPKLASREIVNRAGGGEDLLRLSDVDRMDKAIDAIYFAIGSMHKLGLSPYQIVEGIQVVHEANVAKSTKKDDQGKIIKGKSFIPPEAKLQEILDKSIN